MGPDARKAKTAESRGKLLRAIADLFDRPDKPGWVWPNKKIASVGNLNLLTTRKAQFFKW